MHFPRTRWACGLSAALLSLLAACGGGGTEASSTEAAPAAVPESAKALAQSAPAAGFDLSVASFRTVRVAQSTALVADLARFANPARAYVSLWYTDAAGERHELAFMTLAALRALDVQGGLSLEVPVNVGSVSFEVYDKRGAATVLSGELRA